MNYQEILNIGNQVLNENNIKSSKLDCELILSKILNKTREEILINLDDKIKMNKILIESGANIKEINIVRKHLSDLKGGNLLKFCFPSIQLLSID